ncbi:MAG: hypothetical protein KDB80_00755 [Planctomycetes bacterium]|nr:hypothetical protein [Planctomycetota bacterium]
MRRAIPCLVGMLFGCAVTPYQPARELLPFPEPPDAFERVRDVVRLEYPRLIELDPERFLIRTDWCPRVDREVAAQRRLTMWREGAELCALVEVRYLTGSVFSNPSWTSIRAQPEWERDVLDLSIAALGGEP